MNYRNFAENKSFCSLDLLDDQQLDNCFNDILNLFPKHDNALKICFLSSGNGCRSESEFLKCLGLKLQAQVRDSLMVCVIMTE